MEYLYLGVVRRWFVLNIRMRRGGSLDGEGFVVGAAVITVVLFQDHVQAVAIPGAPTYRCRTFMGTTRTIPHSDEEPPRTYSFLIFDEKSKKFILRVSNKLA